MARRLVGSCGDGSHRNTPTRAPGAVAIDIPTWLIEILRQFPTMVVIGFAVWYAEKRMREKEIRIEER